MRTTLALASALLLASFSHSAIAACFGTGAFQTCNDAAGNNYNVQRFGNMTQMQGSNANTGSTWSQNSQSLGNMNITNGQTNGRSWNETQTNLGGGMRSVTGTNSQGQPYSYTCNQFGCQ